MKFYSSATLPIRDLMWTSLRENADLLDEKPVIDHIANDKAMMLDNLTKYILMSETSCETHLFPTEASNSRIKLNLYILIRKAFGIIIHQTNCEFSSIPERNHLLFPALNS